MCVVFSCRFINIQFNRVRHICSIFYGKNLTEALVTWFTMQCNGVVLLNDGTICFAANLKISTRCSCFCHLAFAKQTNYSWDTLTMQNNAKVKTNQMLFPTLAKLVHELMNSHIRTKQIPFCTIVLFATFCTCLIWCEIEYSVRFYPLGIKWTVKSECEFTKHSA